MKKIVKALALGAMLIAVVILPFTACSKTPNAAGFALPHSEQNLPLFTAPHEHIQPLSGFAFPHSEQNLPVFIAPHAHLQPPASFCFSLPQPEQNLPVFLVPHEHTQLS